MRLSKSLSIKECCTLLGVAAHADMDEVKRAYRKLAFALHPDLNPDDNAAKRRFQQVNEAYVILIRKLSAEQESAARHEAETLARREQEAREKERKENERRERADLEKQERERRETEEREKRAQERRERIRLEQEKQEKKRQDKESTRKQWEEAARRAFERQAKEQQVWEAEQAAKAEALRKEEAARKAEEERRAKETDPRPESHRRTYAKPRAQEPEQVQTAHNAASTKDQNHEDLLRSILSDPKAKEVYEELYQARQTPVETGLKLPWLKKGFSFSGLGEGVEAVKNWLRGQIDEEQTILMPASKLTPGARIRLQIRQGISQELRTVEVALPPDFTPGKPIRLKGMGKKLGRWQGDFYIIFLAR